VPRTIATKTPDDGSAPKAPKSPRKRVSATPSRSKSKSQSELGDELAMELDALRGSLSEMVERYRLRIDANVLQLAAAARGEAPYDGKGRKLPATVTRKMLAQLRALEIEPLKGRAKDFRRLQSLMKDLSKLLPDGG